MFPGEFFSIFAVLVFGNGFPDLGRLGKKSAIIWIILSTFCYYESMTVYEPFITACFIYAVISFAHVWKKRDELGKKSFLKFKK